MNASTIKDYFAKRCTYFKVILLTAVFCMASPMAVYANTQFNFASGHEQLEGHGGSFNKFHKKSHHNEYKWKFKNCKFPIYHDYKFDKDGCSERELSKGKVEVCQQINTKKKTLVKKLCVSSNAADKLLNGRFGDDDEDNDNGVLSYYSPVTFYQDSDGDEYGTSETVTDCLPPDGYVEDQGDCDDTNAAINPGEADGCPVVDGVDNNCDGVVDNGVENIFTDNDGDGFGSASIVGCPGSPNTSLEGGDCNDNDAAVNPDAVEVACNSIDDDCNAETSDNDGGVTVYQDLDQDTFGNPNITDTSYCGASIDGFVSNNVDCDDNNQNINPAQSEIACNSLDDDCDANTSDNDQGVAVYLDADGDGYGSVTSQLAFCGYIPNGYVENSADCDDNNVNVKPGAAEICGDGIDNNCDTQVNENCSPVAIYCNGQPTTVVERTSPATNKVWMDRNLGATRAAVTSTDTLSYGDLYQWGRFTDGHQCRGSMVTFFVQSTTDQPGNGNFLFYPGDWRNPENVNLWQGVNGTNNPCPAGFRLPTATEWCAELSKTGVGCSSPTVNATTLFNNLKLTLAGFRTNFLSGVGSTGFYWTSTTLTGSSNSHNLYYASSGGASVETNNRAIGMSVRCIKN